MQTPSPSFLETSRESFWLHVWGHCPTETSMFSENSVSWPMRFNSSLPLYIILLMCPSITCNSPVVCREVALGHGASTSILHCVYVVLRIMCATLLSPKIICCFIFVLFDQSTLFQKSSDLSICICANFCHTSLRFFF